MVDTVADPNGWSMNGNGNLHLTPVRTRPPSLPSTTTLDGGAQPVPGQGQPGAKRSSSKKQRRRKTGHLATTSMPVTPSAPLHDDASPSISGANTSGLHPFSTPPHQQQQHHQGLASSISAGAAERLIARRASEHSISTTGLPRQPFANVYEELSDLQPSPLAPSSIETPLSRHGSLNGHLQPSLTTVLEAVARGATPLPPTPLPPTPLPHDGTGPSISGTSAAAQRPGARFAGFWEHLHAESHPVETFPTADVVWRQTERDRVYNFLLYVPYQMERVMWMGTFVCLASFLAVLTTLPMRCLRALSDAVTSNRPNHPNRRGPLAGHQLYDVVCVVLLGGAVVCLRLLQPGLIYYWMKDITSEFLKIQVLFTALEILDKIFANFGVDVLEALSSTCTLFVHRRTRVAQLLADALVAFLLITLHGAVLMCEAMVFAVAMNSKRHALMALLIASNFVELKGNVYKRTDTSKLWSLACMDIVERFHLLVVLAFVVVEDVCNSGGSSWLPQHATLSECGRIFGWEIVIDITKHAVLGKFNDIRPGIYREYMRDLCEDVTSRQSNTLHKLVGFCPMGPAALALRMLTTLLWLQPDQQGARLLRVCSFAAVWLVACALQLLLGFVLKQAAQRYVDYRNSQVGGNVRRVIKVKEEQQQVQQQQHQQGASSGAAVGKGTNLGLQNGPAQQPGLQRHKME